MTEAELAQLDTHEKLNRILIKVEKLESRQSLFVKIFAVFKRVLKDAASLFGEIRID
jgi:hypothetical protein